MRSGLQWRVRPRKRPSTGVQDALEAAPEFSVVLPAHNEAGNIAPMVQALARILAPLGSYEIIFVDDGSGDGTLAALRAAAARPRSVTCRSRAISAIRRRCAPDCATRAAAPSS